MNDRITLKESIDFLSHDLRFREVLKEFVGRRESAIIALSNYKTDTELRKYAAEVTVFTEILDMFGVPTGAPVPKPE